MGIKSLERLGVDIQAVLMVGSEGLDDRDGSKLVWEAVKENADDDDSL